MTKIIFLNGPPGCGKDYAGLLIHNWYPGRVHVDKFARVLKESTHALYGVFASGRPAPHYWFEQTKDDPTETFFGLTPRQAYIAVSETYMKKQHGDRIFGALLVKQLPRDVDVIVITDSGFRGEAEVVVAAFGAENCTMVHLERFGCSFDGDSRGRVDLSDLGIPTRVVLNPGDSRFRSVLKQALPELP